MLKKLSFALPPIRRLRKTILQLQDAVKQYNTKTSQQISPKVAVASDPIELLGKYDLDHFKSTAHAYFEKIDVLHDVMRKPFSSNLECALLLPGVGVVIDGLRLFRGARILDFGCGGGWLTRIFAYLGCDAYGIDIAASAVRVSSEALATDPFAGKIKAEFREYDGRRIPFGDEFFDGIAVFDAFHHVPNQDEVLGELYRVLRPGGIVVFHEPGPNHSRLPQSQMEMRNYGVIERDVIIEETGTLAVKIGFEPPQLAFFMPIALWTDVPNFTKLISEPHLSSNAIEIHIGKTVRAHAHPQFANLRVFSLKKPGEIQLDSRQHAGLSAEIEIVNATRSISNIECSLRIVNIGTATWLPSSVNMGGVRLGLQLVSPNGRVLDINFRRVDFVQKPMQTGDSSSICFSVSVPDAHTLRVDLVAEGVVWFEQITGKALKLDPTP